MEASGGRGDGCGGGYGVCGRYGVVVDVVVQR
jgi:hypothetical protein